MTFKTTFAATFAALSFATAGFAADVTVTDSYARVSSKAAKSGAAFMMIENATDSDDRLIDARSDAAKMVQLHTHKEGENGVMQMLHVEEGFAIPAGDTHMLQRGGDHVMLMGLTKSLEHGDAIDLTLVFEKAGEVTVTVPVDLERKPDHGAMKHSH
ncbi:copper chaperone PCu(A)C [Phaeobacter inhibens]|uniref:copper chaperone PCu(A)C n=1 Tax=Phaeobacter inhibens TaxID=221822 RepID=UPI0021A68921|nr:copper chaperone PCu(A)C [Phaeobacter inhibens]UWR42209.1 copper chaperone PCu(A)C [Phaeobacter inhibens]UWR99056.1 copper chaperone PCu(A)C [Phaeobacter inhibens]UWS02946.1 copper chaperone PCu(A)C [Phaeobacter inhibens]